MASYPQDFVFSSRPHGRYLYHYDARITFLRAYQQCGGLGYHVSVQGAQECSVCGYTDPSNRVTQEDFECQECGHGENADSNASKVIRSRLSKAVLRDALLTASELGNGTWEPKTLRHWKVKEILLSLRYKAYPPPLVAESR